MEAIAERRTFDKVMRKLEDIGNILKLCYEVCGGVDANSLNRIKSLADELDGIENPVEYLDGFISDWLSVMPEFKGFLPRWIKRACALYDPRKREQFVKYKPEQFGEDYAQVIDTYERWRNSIILWLSRQLEDGEMIDDSSGTVYAKDAPKLAGRLGRGRKKDESFADCLLVENKSGLLSVLHTLIDGQRGKYVAMVLKICIEEALMKKPTYSQVKNEFGDIGDRFGYYRCLGLKFSHDEKIHVYKSLKDFCKPSF